MSNGDALQAAAPGAGQKATQEQKEAEQKLKDQLYRIRHSAAHVMAQAVLEIYPEAKIAIGPPIENGFYYDFDLGKDAQGKPRTFSPEDLESIEKGMRRIIAGRHPFLYRQVSADEARSLFAGQPYKLELIDGLAKGGIDEYGNESADKPVISTYKQDTFEDLCRGPHLEHTGQIVPDAFKLMTIAGAYWRGDEHNPMLQRIYGTAWRNKNELKQHLDLLEEAKKRDHRKLGRELDGYQRVRSPHLTKEDLFLRSGHLPYYADSMYPPMELEGVKYYVKPMNCPFHHKIYAAKPRSYRELPLRLAEYGTCYRYEKSGELFGLMRVRSMQMNDAHIYCTEEQFEQEFMAVIDLYRLYFDIFNIEKFVMRLSTHHRRGLGKKYIDNERLWLKTESMVRRAMDNGGVPYTEVQDEAAFYGPKIDVQIWSAIGREFTLATNQVDFAQPSRFELHYTTSEGKEETPLCIHRAPLSTHERMIGFLIEHYAGAFPVWLAPQQARIIPITSEHNGYATRLALDLQAAGVRADADLSAERMNAKIRDAQLMKVPYMLVVGDQERADNTIALRKRDGSRANGMPFSAFLDFVQQQIASRTSTL